MRKNYIFRKKNKHESSVLYNDTYLKRRAHYLRMLLMLLTFGISSSGIMAQNFNISYPTPAQGMTVCLNDDSLHVSVTALPSTSTSNVLITVNMAPGVTYKPGTITTLESNPAGAYQVIEHNITNPAAPVFRVVNASTTTSATMAFGHLVRFSIRREAGCNARAHSLAGGGFKDGISVTGSAGTTTEADPIVNNYNVQYPSLTFEQPDPINNAVKGTNYNRTFTITNGSLGNAANIHFYIVYPAGGIVQNSLALAGVGAITPTTTSGDTSFYTLTGTQLGSDGLLTNGEELVFTENIRIVTCGTTTTYRSGWGCSSAPSAWCQTVLGSATVTMATGVPNYTNLTTTNIGYVDMCTPWDVSVQMTNSGSGNINAASMYDVVVQFGMDAYSTEVDGYDTSAASGYKLTNFRIGATTASYTLTGASGNHTLILNTSQFTSDPDGPGGLDDLDSDGLYDDLPSGQSVNLVFTQEFICTTTCNNTGFDFRGPVARLNYNTMCGTAVVPNPRKHQNYFGANNHQNTSNIPPNIVGGVPFTVTLSAAQFSQALPNMADMRYQWRLVLPPGVAVSGTGNPTYNDVPTTYTQIGDTVIITSTSSVYAAATIDLVYTCGSGGTTIFPMQLRRFANSTGCACRGNLLCVNITTVAKCPAPCPEGPTTYQPIVRRTIGSLGFTDHTLTTKVNIDSLKSIEQKRALFMDTIQITSSMSQNTGFNNLYQIMDINKAGTVDKLMPIDIMVQHYSGGVLVSSGTINSFDLSASTVTTTRIMFNISSALAGGFINDGDSVIAISRFRVNTNNLPFNAELPAGMQFAFYNQNALGEFVTCDTWIPEMYLIGTNRAMSPVNGTLTPTACNVTYSDLHITRNHGGSVRLFPNEYRPTQYIDSVVVYIPNGYDFVSATWRSDTADFKTKVQTLTPTTITGNKILFVNDGSWVASNLVHSVSYVSSRLYVEIRPSCGSPATVTPGLDGFRQAIYGKDFYYSNPVPLGSIPTGSFTPFSFVYNGQTINYNIASKPDITLTNLSGTVIGASPAESFNIKVSSTGTSTAPYTWLAIEDNPNFTINNLIDVSTGLPVSPISYSGGKWYQLSSSGILSGQFKDYRIDFNYTTCDLDSIKVFAGWNCSGYPASPDAYPCSADSMFLKLSPANAEVEINPITVPTSVNLCELPTFSYLVNNAQASNVVLNRFNIMPLTGVTIAPASIEVEYPYGSGTWQNVSSSSIGDTIIVDLTDHTNYPVAGIPGVLNAANNEARQIGVRFQLGTDCSFISGSLFTVSTSAISPCGEPAVGSGVPLSNNIEINGLPARTYTNTVVVSGDLENCNTTTTVTVTTQFAGATSSGNGYYYIDLPPYVRFVPGSLDCISGACVTYGSATILPDSGQRVRINIPSGIVDGSNLSYSLEVQDLLKASCGTLNLAVSTLDNINNIPCSTAPGGVCSIFTVQTGPKVGAPIEIVRPDLIVTSLTANKCGGSATGNINVSLSVQNIAAIDQLAGANAVVRIYCGDSIATPIGAPIYTHTLSGALDAGSIITDNFTISGSSCGTSGTLVAIISKADNCICAPNQYAEAIMPDTTAPEIACPTSFSQNVLTASCFAIVALPPVTATDDCSGVTVSGPITSPVAGLISGGPWPIGVHNVKYIVTDASGNKDSCTYQVTVVDNIPPVSTFCPADIYATNAPGTCHALVTYPTPTFSDNCHPLPMLTPVRTTGLASGSLFPVGTTTVTYQVQDASGNTATCSFNVIVQDIVPPTFTVCPTDIEVTTPVSTGAVVTWSAPTATDNGIVTITGPFTSTTTGLASGSTFPIGTTTVSYIATDCSGNTDTCSFDITVSPSEIIAIDDDYGTVSGGFVTPVITNNDSLNGVPVTIGTNPGQVGVSNADPTGNPSELTLNPDGTITVSPTAPSGTYTYTYAICENGASPANCDTAVVTLNVVNDIVATDDDYGTVSGGFVTPVITNNDSLNGVPVTIGTNPGQVGVSNADPTGNPSELTLNPDGTITVSPTAPSGTYTYTYAICENGASPANCDTAVVTLNVVNDIVATDDDYGTVSGGFVTPVITNNDSLNGVPVTIGTHPGQVGVSNADPTGNPSELTLNPDGTITVSPTAPSGTYTYTYAICENGASPANCDTAVVTLNVVNDIVATDDDYGTVSGGFVTPVITNNDSLNGVPVTIGTDPGQVGVSNADPTGNPSELTLNPDGTITVSPTAPSGTYTYTYAICENGASPANCDTAVVTLIVLNDIVATDDDYGTVASADTPVPLGSVWTNDSINGNPITDPTTVTVTQVTPGSPIVINPDGSVTLAPNTPTGVYTTDYIICENGATPANCDTATVTVTVNNGPTSYDVFVGVIPGEPASLNLGSHPLIGSDIDDMPTTGAWTNMSVQITTMPTNGFVLLYNGSIVLPGTIIPNYNPALLVIEPTVAGSTSANNTTFQYLVIDSDGNESNVSDYTVVWNFALPVQLLSFDAKAQGNSAVMTSWAVAKEEGISRYEVEHSTDASHFQSIGNTAATNSSQYSLVHNSPARGANYYRLAMYEADGTTVSYSEVKMVQMNTSKAISMYPNPAKDKVTILLPELTDATVVIYGVDGREVMHTSYTATTMLELHTQTLASGVYSVTVTTTSGDRFVEQLVIKK